MLILKCDMCGDRERTECVAIVENALGEKIALCKKCERKIRFEAWENAHEQWAADSEYGYYPEPLFEEEEEG